jgi:signal peptidase I
VNGRLLLLAAVLVVAAALAVRTWVLVPFGVDGQSMAPTILPGETVVADRVGPLLTGWRAGDVAVLRDPTGSTSVKRLVADGGSVVAIEDGVVIVDDREATAVRLTEADGMYFGPVTVPAGQWFVLGDAGIGSIDSRSYGSIPAGDLVGRLVGRT